MSKLRKHIQWPSLSSIIVISIVAFVVLSGLAVWKLPQQQAERIKQKIEINKTKKRLDAQELFNIENTSRANIIKVLQAIGGLSFILTGYFSWRALRTAEKNREISEDKQITERFSKAVELMSENAKPAAHIGGIYLLERIAKDSAEDHGAIMEVLTAFIRGELHVDKQQEYIITNQLEQNKCLKINPGIQAALTVIGRRDALNDVQRLNFRYSALSEANLSNAYLRGADFCEVDFRGANLSKADLEKADLSNSDLKRANFRSANLSGADLSDADLSRADLSKADLSGANLSGADLSKADLSGANLSGAELRDADLDRTDLRGALSINSENLKVCKNWQKATYSSE